MAKKVKAEKTEVTPEPEKKKGIFGRIFGDPVVKVEF